MTSRIHRQGATLRRIIMLGLATLVALFAANIAAPDEAHAIINPNVVTASHTGWVYVKSAPQFRCGALLYYGTSRCYSPSSQTAWRWSGSSWSQTSIAGGTQVYAYPYSGDWHWIWTQRTGWLAIETAKLETGYSCTGWNCPLY